MTTISATVEERMPVWIALSELFLDTELQEEDHRRIAHILAASPYSEKKLDEILRFEVTPALKWNLMSVAGEWAGFDNEWLREKLTPRIDKKPWFRLGVFWMMKRRWAHIISLVVSARKTPNPITRANAADAARLNLNDRRKMKIGIILIGLLITLGGITAVLAPKPWTMIGGGTKYNKTITVTEFSKESCVYFGWAAIGLGIVALVIGLRYEKIVMQPTEPADEP